jgi:putative ABC transport system substrate-binding protein
VFLFLVFSCIPAPGGAEDHQDIVIAVLSFDTEFLNAQRGLADGLQQINYSDKKVRFIIHDLKKDLSQIPAIIEQLKQQQCDLIMTTTTPVVLAVKKSLRKTDSIPVVFTMVADPVGLQVVSSLQKPEGYITGISYNAFAMIPKRLELFRDAFPEMENIAIFYDYDKSWIANPIRELVFPAAESLGFKVHPYNVRTKEDMIAMSSQIDSSIDGLFMVPDPRAISFFGELLDLSRQHKLPLMVLDNMLLKKGGVMGYSPSFYGIGQQAAFMIHKILTGTPPGKLSVQNPAVIRLVASLKEANRLDLILPDSFLMNCDAIIR